MPEEERAKEEYCATCDTRVVGPHLAGSVCPTCVRKAKTPETKVIVEETMRQARNLAALGIKPEQAATLAMFQTLLNRFVGPAIEKLVPTLPTHLDPEDANQLRKRIGAAIEKNKKKRRGRHV